jgi:copper chaperone NosL
MEIGRRRVLIGAALLASCCSTAQRCAYCGMKIDPASPWRADLVLADGTAKHFDTPRCALTAWRTGRFEARTIRVQDYYDRTWRDGSEMRFVLGSDVMGPMGPDLVPVDPSRANKFALDHTAARPLPLSAVTAELLSEIK